MSEENLGQTLIQEDASTNVLYEQLRNEYNKLLKQYAAAENTIDELRTGATVHLYTEPLESTPNNRLSVEAARYPQNINFPKPLQANTSPVSTMNESCTTNSTGGHSLTRKEEVKTPTQRQNTTQKPPIQARIQALKEDVATVESVLSESGVNEETLNELLAICTQLHKEHGLLSSELKLLQSRDINTRFSTQSDPNSFSTKTELEKELYRIGLRIEELRGDISARLKMKKPASLVKSAKPVNDDKPTLRPDLEDLVKEMKDLKDASIRSSEEVLNSSRMENTRTRSDLPRQTLNKRPSKERRRYSEPNHDVVDSRYFAASPVNPEYSLSGSDGSDNGDEQTLNMTWPPSRNAADPGIKRHSFLETTQDYTPEDSRKSSQRSLNSAHDQNSQLDTGYDQTADMNYSQDCRTTNSSEDFPMRSQSIPDHIGVDTTGQSGLQSSINHSILNHSGRYSENPASTDNFHVKPDSMPQYSRQKPSRQLPNQQWSDLERKNPFNLGITRDQTSYSDQETLYHREKKFPYSDHETSHKEKKSKLPKRDEKLNQATQHRLGSPDLDSRKFHSMSSLADSSRMSTPLFQPRGATRVSPHAPRYKRRNPSDGFDSGFVGSEASRSSRLTTDHPDGIQKLNLSNQWDSALQLDLVSELDENESPSSPEQIPTAYELPEDGRRPPRKSHQLTEDIKLINTSPSPPSSPERTPRAPAGYPGYRTSRTRLSGSGNSLPVHDTGLGAPSLSHISERPSLEHRSSKHSGAEGISRTRMDRRRRSRGYSGTGSGDMSRDVSPEVTADSGERVRSWDRTEEHHNERKLQALRNELDSLHDHVNKLDHPRVTTEMYDELRHHDEHLRKAHERRHDQKLNELRQTIEQLKKDIKSRDRSEKYRRKPDHDPGFYDDFRSELRKVTDKLDEWTTLRSGVPLESPSTHMSPRDDDDIARSFSNLVRKVDELRLRIENDSPRENPRNSCRLCDEVNVHHHGNQTITTADQQPRTSTPFVSEVYPATRQLPKTKVDYRSYLSSTYPGALQQQSPVVHHIHTYHKGPALKQPYEADSSSEDDNYVKRTPHRKRSVHRLRHRSRHFQDTSYNDVNDHHPALDEARKAAWDVQRLSKNILNSITLDLTSLLRS